MALDPDGIYYGIDGERHGPVDVDALRERLAAGSVSPEDFVWDDDVDDWVPIGRYPALLSPETPPPGPVEAASEPSGPGAFDHAGFGMRFLAWLVDVMVLLIPIWAWELTAESLSGFDIAAVQPVDPMTTAPLPDGAVAFLLWFHVGAAVLRGTYWTLMESSRLQATLGKRALGLVVTDERGRRLSASRALVRYLGRLLCELTFGVGYLLIAFDPRHQGLHDRIARTLVVRT